MYNGGVHSFIIMKKIEISIPDKDYDLLTRIAQNQKRRLSDLHYLIYSEGINYFFCETDVNIEKKDFEYTEEEKKQKALNKKLEKDHDGFWKKEDKERKKLGYKPVRTYMSNHEYDHENDEYKDGLIKPLAERIESYSFNPPTDEEVKE